MSSFSVVALLIGVAVGCSGSGPSRKPEDPSFAVPAPLRPWNGEMTGSSHAARALEPRFQWKAVDGAASYELQVDDSCPATGFAGCAFPSPEIDLQNLPSTSYTPVRSLPVSLARPVGRRYFWRVRACHAAGCSPWSAVRYVDVGRMMQDLNGDGYADLMIGADFAGGNAGQALIYWGRSGPLAGTPDIVLTGEQPGDGYGYYAEPIGDVNADGYPDLIVSAFTNAAGGVNAGRAYVYLGGETLRQAPDLTLTGNAGDHYGIAVSDAGDLNGDGYADFLVGAAGVGAGRVEIFFGGPALHGTADLTLAGQADGEFFGYPAQSVGDVNGDGFADLLVAAISSSAAGKGAGRAYVFLGGAAMDAEPDLTLDGEAAGDSFGASLAAAGDFDGDGYGDLAISAYLNDGGGVDAGRAYLYRGGATLHAAPDFTVNGGAPGASLHPVAFADLNGDGLDDLVTASGAVGGYSTFVYFGGAALHSSADLSIGGVDDVFAISNAGDVNGDGFVDLVVGAPSTGSAPASAQPGKVYLFRGAQAPVATPAASLTGPAPGTDFGVCVAWGDDRPCLDPRA